MRGWNAKSLKNRIREGGDERQKSCPDWRKTGRACSGRGPLQIFRDWVQKTEFLPVAARWLVAGYLSTWSVLGRSNQFTQLRAAFRREGWGRERDAEERKRSGLGSVTLFFWKVEKIAFATWSIQGPWWRVQGGPTEFYSGNGSMVCAVWEISFYVLYAISQTANIILPFPE